MLWKLKKSMGKEGCFFFAFCFGILSFGSFLGMFFLGIGCFFIFLISIIGMVILILAMHAEPEIEIPFYHSLDDEGNHIMTNGTQTVYVDDHGDVSSKKNEPSVGTSTVSSEEKKTELQINYRLEERIINRQMEIEDSGEELTPVRRLRILKELFNDGDMTLEEYKDKKETVILIYLDDFLEEIEYQETDSKVAFNRKMNYVKSLYQDNLIDTEEFESIKAEIMEDMDEKV